MERNWRGLEWRELANNFSLLRSLQLRESGISSYQNIIKNYSEGRWLYYTPAPHTLNIRDHHYYDQCILTSWLANQRLQITVFSTFLNREHIYRFLALGEAERKKCWEWEKSWKLLTWWRCQEIVSSTPCEILWISSWCNTPACKPSSPENRNLVLNPWPGLPLPSPHPICLGDNK